MMWTLRDLSLPKLKIFPSLSFEIPISETQIFTNDSHFLLFV